MAFFGKVGGEWQKLSTFNTYKSFSLVGSDTNGNVKKVLEDGSGEAWNFGDHTDAVSDVALTEAGGVVTASTDGTVRKADENGQQLWQFDPGTNQNFASIAVGPDGYVFSGDANAFLRKISPDGTTEVWQFGAASNVNGVDVDQSGYAYLAAGDTIQKVDPEGNSVWDFLGHNRTTNGIRVGADGAVYTSAFGGTVKKIAPNGEEIWSFGSFSSAVNDVAVNENNGDVYGFAGSEIRKMDNETGDQLFEYTTITNTINTGAVSKRDFVYAGDNNGNFYKLEDNGSGFDQIFTFQGFENSVQGNDVQLNT